MATQHDYPTPLIMAVMQRKKEAARLLLERGANPRIKNPAGADALELARKMDRPELVPLLECAMAIVPGNPSPPHARASSDAAPASPDHATEHP